MAHNLEDLNTISKAGFGGISSTSSLAVNPTDAGGNGAGSGGGGVGGGGGDGGGAAGRTSSISKTSILATATASPSSSSTALPAPTVIQFNNADNFPLPNERVYDIDDTSIKVFKWDFNGTFALKRIRWYSRSNSATAFDDKSDVLGDVDLSASGIASNKPFGTITNTSAQLLLTDAKLAALHWDAMAIKIDWETSLATGYSESGIFTVAQGAQTRELASFNDNAKNNSADNDGTELISDKGADSGSVGGGGGTVSGGGGSGSSSSGKKSGGLSTGAKAGIGIGCALVALLLIGALVFVLLRRKKRSAKGGSYRDQPPVASYIVDKEDSRARAVESPASPYSDDGHRQSHDAANQPIARGHDIEEEPLPRASSSRVDGTETPPAGVSRHLVEDGMTREEIQRLEEEERQLDAEIERAARGV